MSKQWDWGNDWGNDVVIGCMFQCWLVGEILCGNSENNIDKFHPPKFIRCTFHLWRMNPWWNLVLFAVFWFIGRSPSDLPKKMDTPQVHLRSLEAKLMQFGAWSTNVVEIGPVCEVPRLADISPTNLVSHPNLWLGLVWSQQKNHPWKLCCEK